MREMADRPGNVIVLLIVEYDRNRFQGADKIPERGHLFLRNFCRRREDIVGIFDQVGFGAGESALLRSCHRVPSDEAFLHAE